ncbi:MAG: TIGR04255 family protein [Clostridia bacterium]|nr:TIGR04255 family protein [Clostridia bacterium]
MERTDFHYNFLKNVIVRLDLQGVVDAEFLKIIPSIKTYLKERNFNRLEEKTAAEINIELKQTGMVNDVKTLNNHSVYSFYDDVRGFSANLSSKYIILNIRSTKYFPFEEYRDIVSDLYEIYKRNVDFIQPKRFGIRKDNVCIVDSLETVIRYFDSNYFGYFSKLDDIKTKISNRKNHFECDEKKINLFCDIFWGKNDVKEVYKVELDIDVYCDNQKLIESCLTSEELDKINQLIFKIYNGALTDEFVKLLSQDKDANFAGIEGIEYNE